MRLEYPQLFEADVFQGPSPDDLRKRKEQAAKLRKQEIERRIKEMGPTLKKIRELIPQVREAEKRYTDAAEEYRGNYGESGYYDFPKKVSFNIKIYDYDIPDEATDKFDKYGLWDAFESRSQLDREFALEGLVEDLQTKYPFITTWGIDGRSGGWLVLDLDGIGYEPDDINSTIQDIEDTVDPDIEFGENWDERELQNVVDDLEGYITAIDMRIAELGRIETEIGETKEYVRKMYTQEWLDDFFTDYADEMVDEEELEERRIKEDIFKSVSPEDLAKRREHLVTEDDIMDLEQDIIDAAREEADKIYKKLSETNDYYMSDEGIAEELTSREEEFTIDSKTGELDEDGDKTVYFDELSDDNKEKVFEKFRNSAYWPPDWVWDDVNGQTWKDKNGYTHHDQSMYQEDLEEAGFEDAEIFVSGFYSQGGGASFACHVNIPKVVKHYKIEVKPKVQKAIDAGLFSGQITTSGHYSHSNTMNLDLQYEDY